MASDRGLRVSEQLGVTSPTNEFVSPSKWWSVFTKHVGRLPRYIVLAIVLVAALSAIAFFYRECVSETTTAPNGDITQVVTCSPPTLASSALLIVLLMVVGLLWPDLAEVTVLGVGLKRSVKAAIDAASVASEGVQTLSRVVEVQQVRLDAMAIAAATANVNLYFGAAELPQLKEAAAKVEEDAKELGVAKPDLGEVEDDSLKIKVIRSWERLNDLLDFSGARLRADRIGGDPDLRPIQQAFIDDHAQSIRIARELRNAVAHDRPVSRPNLVAGASLFDDLIVLAENWLIQSGQIISE